jgi:hypothetical protein
MHIASKIGFVIYNFDFVEEQREILSAFEKNLNTNKKMRKNVGLTTLKKSITGMV